MIKADLHVHSLASTDARSTIEELIAAAKAAGLDAITISDHDACTPLPPCEDLLLISGAEINTTSGHILGLFLARPIDLAALRANGRPSVKAAVTAIHACGGVAVLAHPFAPQKLPVEELERLPVDLIEGCNARAALKKNHANEQARALAARVGKAMTAGSDAHSAPELGAAYTNIDCAECTIDALREAVLAGKTEPILVHACRWRYKGLSRLASDRRHKRFRPKSWIFFFGTLLRDLVQR